MAKTSDLVAKKSHWFVIRLTPPLSCHTSTTCFPGAANTPLPAPRTISVESPRRLIDAQLTSDWRPIDVQLTSDWRPIDARLAPEWRWILRSATLSDAAWSVDAWRLTMNLDIGAANDGDFVSLSCFCRNYQSRIRHWIGMFVRRNERHELGGALSAFLILSMVQNIKRGEWVYDADDGKGVRL